MKNSADRAGCYPPRPEAEGDNSFRDLQNSWYPTKAEFNNCFIHGGHRMTQNRSPSASLVAILDQALFVEDWVLKRIKWRFSVLPRRPSEVGSKSLKRDSRPFVCYQTRVGFFVFLDITALVFQPCFVPVRLIRKGVFFCLHSFSSVSAKTCLFYFHSINSESNVDRMFLVFEKEACARGLTEVWLCNFVNIAKQTNCSEMARQLTDHEFSSAWLQVIKIK